MTSKLTALVENVITCPLCLKHFHEPRMLPCSHTFCFQCLQQMTVEHDGLLECPEQDGTKIEKTNVAALPLNEAVSQLVKLIDHPNPDTEACHRCATNKAEFWCDSDCKHCFCPECWNGIHAIGQYQHHKKVPIKDRPPEISVCQEHEQHIATHWCEGCNKEICKNCQEFKHKDHPFVLVTGDVKPIDEECETGLDAIQMCLAYRVNRVEKMESEMKEEFQNNQEKVTRAMASFRQIIDQQEREILQNLKTIEQDQKKKAEDFKCLLQGEQQGLIQETLNFVIARKDKRFNKRKEAKILFDDYIRRADARLMELKPLVRIKYNIPGLDEVDKLNEQLRDIKLVQIEKHKNQELEQKITNGKNSTSLDLSSLNLTDRDMELVAQEIEINRTLTTLQLYTTQITDIGTQHLADALRLNKTLNNLNLPNSPIGDDGAEHLADALRTNKSLINVNLQNIKLEEHGIQQLMDSLKANKVMGGKLQNINVQKGLTKPARKNPPYANPQLSQKIANNGNNTTLYLHSSNYTDDDMEIVADAIEKNTVITTLTLYDNKIGDTGAAHIAYALGVNKAITYLRVDQNQIGDQGAQHLGDALKVNKALTLLQLQNNKIGDSGAQHIAAGLKENKTLTKLWLHENQIGDRGAQLLGDALKSNQTLTTLYLPYPSISANLRTQLQQQDNRINYSN